MHLPQPSFAETHLPDLPIAVFSTGAGGVAVVVDPEMVVQSLHLSELLQERRLRNLRHEGFAVDDVELRGSARHKRQRRRRRGRRRGDSSVGSVFYPLQRCKRKRGDQGAGVGEDRVEVGRIGGAEDGSERVDAKEDGKSSAAPSSWKILSYNVWFREDLEMHKRIKAIGELVQIHSPHVICFQEVTPDIYDIFQLSSWWKLYHCSVLSDAANLRPYFCMLLSKLPVRSFICKPFGNSVMGRELCTVEVEVEGKKPLVIATSHLESPCPGPPKWDQMYSKERVVQAKEAMDHLSKYPNVILGGDMNWDDKLDGRFPLRDEWVDAWEELRPSENGWTYDTKSNPMLSANRTLQKRLDRFLCSLHDFKITGIDMIGREAIPGLTYCKEKKVRKELTNLVLPVLPSDHFGLLLTIGSK